MLSKELVANVDHVNSIAKQKLNADIRRLITLGDDTVGGVANRFLLEGFTKEQTLRMVMLHHPGCNSNIGCMSWYKNNLKHKGFIWSFGEEAKFIGYDPDTTIDNSEDWKFTNENMFNDPTQRATRPQSTIRALMELVEELKHDFKEYTELKDKEIERLNTLYDVSVNNQVEKDEEIDELRSTISALKDQIVRMSNPQPTKPSWFKGLFK
jgi:hypothetical protein